jgi:hypothetical protein
MNVPTPPATQLPLQVGWRRATPIRHERFYCQDPKLRDPVILQVRWPAYSSSDTTVTIPQVENTLYRLSIYGLTQRSHFFATIFTMDNGDSPEGKSDEHPIILPSTITCAEFEVYLRFGVE